MKSTLSLPSGKFTIDIEKPIDISLAIQPVKGPQAWYIGAPKINPVANGDWVAEVAKGATINFNTIQFSPHAHGTHTEGYGHISKEFYSVSNCLKRFFFTAKLISIAPEVEGDDTVFTQDKLAEKLRPEEAEALIIRTIPNNVEKKNKNHNHTNWPYLKPETAKYIRQCGVKHLLIDLPSVDKEEGNVVAHRAFWNYPDNPQKEATITELIYVPDEVEDGLYVLNLQVANFVNNAAPSRPVLYKIEEQ